MFNPSRLTPNAYELCEPGDLSSEALAKEEALFMAGAQLRDTGRSMGALCD